VNSWIKTKKSKIVKKNNPRAEKKRLKMWKWWGYTGKKEKARHM